MNPSTLTIEPLGPAIGARISGVQLADGITDAPARRAAGTPC